MIIYFSSHQTFIQNSEVFMRTASLLEIVTSTCFHSPKLNLSKSKHTSFSYKLLHLNFPAFPNVHVAVIKSRKKVTNISLHPHISAFYHIGFWCKMFMDCLCIVVPISFIQVIISHHNNGNQLLADVANSTFLVLQIL